MVRLKPLEKILLQSPLVPWSYFASNFITMSTGTHLQAETCGICTQNPWGQLFQSYGDGKVVMPGMEPKTVVQAGVAIGRLQPCWSWSLSC